LKKRFPFRAVVTCLLTILILGAIGILAEFLDYTRPTWPKIRDENHLISDAHLLISKNHTAAIPPAEWPESIRALNPRSVLVGENEYVEVVISAGGIGQPYSYIIFKSPDDARTFTVPYRQLHPTNNPFIFKLY
jgi:hypothetical protein